MRIATLLATGLLTATIAACATTGGNGDSDTTLLGSGVIVGARQSMVGSVRIVQTGSGPELTVTVSSMPPGRYGIHLHSVGRCDAPAFTTAGPHWNPTMRQHGRLNPMGTHHGDLPNLVVAANGSGMVKAPFVGSLTGNGGLFDADGAALVLHARADDERTDPSGNSGDRIACAVLSPG